MKDFFMLKNDNKDPLNLKLDRDYYIENGCIVFTELFLKKRGYCCENNCRHCPYGFVNRLKLLQNKKPQKL